MTVRIPGNVSGNAEWRALAGEAGSSREVLPPLKDEDITIRCATNLVAHIINDAKYNIIKENKKYSKDSTAFLRNHGRSLEYLLCTVHVDDMDRCLYTLYTFATTTKIKVMGYLRRMV